MPVVQTRPVGIGWEARERGAEGLQAPRCEWGCRESCRVLRAEAPGPCTGGGSRAADSGPGHRSTSGRSPTPPAAAQPGPTRGLGSSLACAAWARPTPKLSPGVAGGRRGLNVLGRRGACDHAAHGRGLAPPAASEGRCPARPASWHKTKVRVRGVGGGRGGAGGRGQTGRPGTAGVRGLRDSAAPPQRGGTAGTALRAADAESRLQRVRGCSRGHTCGAPASPGAPQSGAPILINALIRGRH